MIEKIQKNWLDIIKRDKRFLLLLVLLCFFVASESVIFFRNHLNVSATPVVQQKNYAFSLKNVVLNEVPFSQKEREFFVKREVAFSKKFEGRTESGIPFSLLIVASKSWKSHHNPEVCLQGLGYQLGANELLQIDQIKLRKIQLENSPGQVLYWFSGKDKTLNDYSERVWEGLLAPNQNWTLIEIGFDQPVNLKTKEMEKLVVDVNEETKIFQD